MTALTRQEIDAMLLEHFEAERTKDIDRLLATFTEDAAHDVVEFEESEIHGHAAIRKRYEEILATFEDDRFDRVRRYYGPDFAVDESVAHGRAISPDGERGPETSVRLLHIFEFRDGKVSRENLWTDVVGVMRQTGQMPRGAAAPTLA